MKAKSLILATTLLLTLGAGAAHATETTPTPEPTVTAPAQGWDPTLIVVLTPPYLGADGQIVGPQPQDPSLSEYFTWWAVTENNMVTVTASVIPGAEASTDLTLTDRSGAVDVIVFEPIALPVVSEIPTTQCGDVVDGFPVGDNADMCDNPPIPEVPAAVVPAPVVETPQPGFGSVTVAPEVPATSYAPDAATSERVAAGEELAYTGVGTGLLLLGVMVVGAGIGVLYFNSQVRRV